MSPLVIRSRYDLAKHFASLGYTRGAEIGVAGGRYSLALCTCIPNLELICVDTWERYKGNRRGGKQCQHDDNYETAQRRLAPYRVKLVRSFSTEAARDVALDSLDFVYIDANHDFDYVMEDIITWARKVRGGGMVSGHDYYQFQHSGVIEAVDAYVGWHHLELHLTCKEVDYGEISWYFTKP